MKHSRILNPIALALSLTLTAMSAASAAPTTASRPVALALAAVVAQHSPLLLAHEKQTMARLFAGDSSFFVKSSKTISVTADGILCRTSNVDLTARSCELTFKKGNKRSVKGREANEIYATLATAGAVAEGAAGTIFEGISKLNCTIDPHEISQKSGAGADCSFDTTN